MAPAPRRTHTGPGMTTVLEIQRLPHAHDLPLPRYQTAGAAGLDLHAAVELDVVLAPGTRALVPTGLRLSIPSGFEAQLRPRSGLALHHGITLLNSPGTVDSDYVGEVKVILVNLGQAPFTVTRGMRVAQLIVSPVTRVEVREVQAIDTRATTRGENGFGHTGAERDGGRPVGG